MQVKENSSSEAELASRATGIQESEDEPDKSEVFEESDEGIVRIRNTLGWGVFYE